jgi:hypothetical protein
MKTYTKGFIGISLMVGILVAIGLIGGTTYYLRQQNM